MLEDASVFGRGRKGPGPGSGVHEGFSEREEPVAGSLSALVPAKNCFSAQGSAPENVRACFELSPQRRAGRPRRRQKQAPPASARAVAVAVAAAAATVAVAAVAAAAAAAAACNLPSGCSSIQVRWYASSSLAGDVEQNRCRNFSECPGKPHLFRPFRGSERREPEALEPPRSPEAGPQMSLRSRASGRS